MEELNLDQYINSLLNNPILWNKNKKINLGPESEIVGQ